MRKYLITFLKGIGIGSSMLVPGVSGGTMAILLNIYDELISSVNSVSKLKFKKLPFLFVFVGGSGLGMLLFASPLEHLILLYPKPTLFFFIGAVIGGLPVMYKKAGIKSFRIEHILYPAIGFLIIMLIGLIPAGVLDIDLSDGFTSYIVLLAVGIFIIAAALVLPGISTSFMLLTLGLYTETLNAISNMYLPFIIPLAAGTVIGIFLVSRALEAAMKAHPAATYLVIIGFVIGSAFEIRPGLPTGFEAVLCILLFFTSFIILYYLSKIEE